MPRGEAEAPERPIRQPGPRKARGEAARAVVGPEWAEAFGQRLGLALQGRGLSPGQAARTIGVTPTAVRHWCKGRRLPNVARLFRLVAVLGLDPRLIAPEWFV